MAAEYTRALLLGARGNSGVIASQLMGAFFQRLLSGAMRCRVRWSSSIAQAMRAAAQAAYAAVGEPVEGTILTVARKAAEAAEGPAGHGTASVFRVVRAAGEAAQDALARTPSSSRSFAVPVWSTPAAGASA